MSFESILLKCPIRSLHFHDPFLLIGYGNRLDIYSINNDSIKFVISKVIFKAFNINGIVSVDSNVTADSIIFLLFGNRFLTVYELSHINTENVTFTKLCPLINVHDWIIDGRVINDIAIMVLAHNEVIIYNWKLQIIIDTKKCSDRCILYSAKIVSQWGDTDFVIASGTVFKEIVIWSSYDHCLQRLKGHDGVIFAIEYNDVTNTIVSASDDRSVRIWISEKSECGNNNRKFWQKNMFVLTHILYSHDARIWKIAIINVPYEIVVSVGEDSAVCFWDTRNGSLIVKERGPKNSSIWSLAINGNSCMAFTGASDSCVIMWNIENVLNKIPPQIPMQFECRASAIAFVCIDHSLPQIFISSNDGNLLFLSNDNDKCTPFDTNEILKSYCTIDINENRDTIILGTKCGSIGIVQFDKEKFPKVLIKKCYDGKVFSVCYANDSTFISCGPKGLMKVWDLQFNSLGDYILPLSRHRWPKAALLFNNILMIGDRIGGVYIYSNLAEPIQEFRNLHSPNGVTCIQRKLNSNLVYTCGRNGKIFQLLLQENTYILLRTYKTFTEMEWIGRLILDPHSDQLSYVIGFGGRNLLVWSATESRFVWSVDCGGGHRLWDFIIRDKCAHLIYIKEEKLFKCTKKLGQIYTQHVHELFINHTQNFHSKKINVCTILSNLAIGSKNFYFATGGDDNHIFINQMNYNDAGEPEFKIELRLEGHISNVSGLSSCSIPLNDVCYLLSVGGRSQIIIWKIYFFHYQLIARQMISNFLWTNNSINRKPWEGYVNAVNEDNQIRYLKANLINVSPNKFLICIVCSDPALRLFLYDSNSNALTSLYAIHYENNCIFNLSYLTSLKLITCSNDGIARLFTFNIDFNKQIYALQKVKLCEMPEDICVNLELQCHQSGINSIDTRCFCENYWLIACGGDDNKLTLNVIRIHDDHTQHIASTEDINAHTSQISGIKITSKNTIITASIDQRIVLWYYTIDIKQQQLSMTRIASYITSIADLTSLEALCNDNYWYYLVICGDGCEIIKCHP